MRFWSNSFRDGGAIPADYAFASIAPFAHVRPAANRNPHLAWDDVPGGTESLALFCHDADAPLDRTDANRDHVTLRHGLPRVDFFHWVLLDLPPTLFTVAAGQMSDGVTPCGKAAPQVVLRTNGVHRHTLRQGLNDYTDWYAGDPAMAGDYYGYDGPCPPWNDERIHHYLFRLYALDLPLLVLPARFGGRQARAAMYGHILDEAQIVGAYSLNPGLARTLKQ